jgi:hypothetical protein
MIGRTAFDCSASPAQAIHDGIDVPAFVFSAPFKPVKSNA